MKIQLSKIKIKLLSFKSAVKAKLVEIGAYVGKCLTKTSLTASKISNKLMNTF